MAANNIDGGGSGKTEASAKLIGFQLQSLLKIPPINKEDQQKNTLSALLPSISNKKGDSGRTVNEKENRRASNSESTDGISKGNVATSKLDAPSSSAVPRDRFGRPFQSLERRGRGGGGRDFHNGPKRFVGGSAGNPQRGDLHVTTPTPPAPVDNRESEPHPGNHNMSSSTSNFPKGRLPPTRQITGGSLPINSSVSPLNTGVGFNDRLSQSRKPPLFPSYEQPPRFAEEPVKGKVVDNVDPAVRQLAKRNECPTDIKENIEAFYESGVCSNDRLLTVLKKHYIHFLVKKSSKFPRAKYYCFCCNYHMDNLYATLNHVLNERHYTSEKSLNVVTTITFTPVQHPPEKTIYLTEMITKTAKLYGMNTTERTQRLDVIHRLNEALKEAKLDYQASLFGSSYAGFALRDSNVNININVGGAEVSSQTAEKSSDQPSSPRVMNTANNPSEFMEISAKLMTIIKKLSHVREQTVKETCTAKCISVHFEEDKTRASCIIHYNNSSAVLAAQLFAEYESFDNRVKPLVTCFRYWAKVCDIDDQEKGFLPPHCYTLMVLHFLIRKKLILPNLHLLPKTQTDKLFATAEEAKRNWTSPNLSKESVGELWLDLLRYFAFEFSYKTDMVTVSREDPAIPKNEKQWNRRLCIEDPILPKSNLCRIVTSSKICDYIIDRIKSTYIYFAVPRKATGPLYAGIFNETTIESTEIFQVTIEGSKPTSSETLQKMVRQIQMGGRRGSEMDDLNAGNKVDKAEETEVRMAKISWRQNIYNYIHFDDAKKLQNILFKREYSYDFKQDNFNDGLLPPLICKSCGAEGHLKSNCPEETIPPFVPVEAPTPLSLTRLSKAIYSVFDKEALDRHDVNIRAKIVDEVRNILLPLFPSVCLTLFGSTYNGFGMHASDVDICLTFNDIVVPPDQRGIKLVDAPSVLEKIVTALKVSGKMAEILSIPSAKVPIVKFRHIASGLEGDISLYNRLSIYNTELLRLYVDIDSRVARLGLFLKRLVKLCDIGDASKGSLSSYSYILMLIHFLQNHSVPVLPVLQELHVPGSKNFVDYQCDNHHVKYSKDLNRIIQTWTGYGKNKESISHLWLAFLNYYIVMFDFDKSVITISQSAPLSRVAKSWYTDAIAIEDPFDKTHNLGLGLTRRMSVHIIKTLQKFRTFFNRPSDHVRNEVYLVDFYLDSKNVRDGNPPIDRQCRLCNRIGHFARSCTYVNKPEDGNNKRVDEEEPHVTPFDNYEEHQSEINTFANGSPKDHGKAYKNTAMVKEDSPEKVKSLHGSPVKHPWGPTPNISPIKNSDDNGRGILKKFVNGSLIQGPGDSSNHLPHPHNQMMINSPTTTQIRVESLKPAIGPIKNQTLSTEESKPMNDIFIFGDIGSANPEGEQIKAMLQKNEGVTFTFGMSGQDATAAENASQPEMLQNNSVGNVLGQPPPGFRPPGNIYPPNGLPSHAVPFTHEQLQGYRPMLANPIISQPYNMPPIGIPLAPQPAGAPWQNHMAMPVRFQPLIPVTAIPFDTRQQANGEASERSPLPGSSAPPPPGFAPLPSATNGSQQHQPGMMRGYPPPFSGVPNVPITVSMYSVAPVGMSYQPPTSYTSPIISDATNDNLASVIGYRPIAPSTEPSAPLYDGPMMANRPVVVVTSIPSMVTHHMNSQLTQFPPNFHQPQQHRIPMNVNLTNGQVEDSTGANAHTPFIKTTSASAENMFSTEFAGGIVPGNPSVGTYAHGLSLSQAHHGPVVSALQMQHSQHHPLQMQGGHFHPVRPPFVPLGAYPAGSPYGYPSVHVPHLPQQPPPPMPIGSDQLIPMHGVDPTGTPLPLEAKHAK